MRKAALVITLLVLIVLAVVAFTKLVEDTTQAKVKVEIPKQKIVTVTVETIKEVPVEKETVRYKYIYVDREIHWYEFKATGYSANDPAQGTTSTMANGAPVAEGYIAADRDVLPLGTTVEIKGLGTRDGTYIVGDTGAAIRGMRIDVFCNTKLDALQINQSIWVRILNSGS